MIRTLQQMFWADAFIKECRQNKGNHLSGNAGIPPEDFKDVYEGLIEDGIIERISTGGAKLTKIGWGFKSYLIQPKMYEDYPKLMRAFTPHFNQDFINPDFEVIAEGQDDEKNFRNNHHNKEVKSFSRRKPEVETLTETSNSTMGMMDIQVLKLAAMKRQGLTDADMPGGGPIVDASPSPSPTSTPKSKTVDKRDYELVLLQEFSQLKKDCKTWQTENSDLIGVKFKDLEVEFYEHAAPDKFYYRIKEPRYEQRPPGSWVTCVYRPQHNRNPNEYGAGMQISQVADNFKMWLDNVKAYASLSLDVDDEFLDKYQKEYFDEFKIMEDDADSAPFKDKQQKLLYYTLESIEEAIVVINEPDVYVDDIIQEARELKEKIPTLTQNQMMSKYSKIVAQIKLKGFGFATKLGKKVGEIMLSKGVGKMVDYIYTEAPKWIEYFAHHGH